MSSSHTRPGTVVCLVIRAATVVAHGDLQLRVTLPGHPSQVVHLPLVDEHFRPLVEVHPHAPEVRAGQSWRGEGGELLFAVRWRREAADAGEDFLIAADGGGSYTPQEAVAAFGELTLAADAPPAAGWDPDADAGGRVNGHHDQAPIPAPAPGPAIAPNPGPQHGTLPDPRAVDGCGQTLVLPRLSLEGTVR